MKEYHTPPFLKVTSTGDTGPKTRFTHFWRLAMLWRHCLRRHCRRNQKNMTAATAHVYVFRIPIPVVIAVILAVIAFVFFVLKRNKK
jgi:hypothetical protein